MIPMILKMTTGDIVLLAVLFLLVIFLVIVGVKEKQRKERSRIRAEERRKKREEALRKMREEEAQLEGLRASDLEEQKSSGTPEDESKLSDLDTLSSVRREDKDTNTFQTGVHHFSTGTVGNVSDGKVVSEKKAFRQEKQAAAAQRKGHETQHSDQPADKETSKVSTEEPVHNDTEQAITFSQEPVHPKQNHSKQEYQYEVEPSSVSVEDLDLSALTEKEPEVSREQAEKESAAEDLFQEGPSDIDLSTEEQQEQKKETVKEEPAEQQTPVRQPSPAASEVATARVSEQVPGTYKKRNKHRHSQSNGQVQSPAVNAREKAPEQVKAADNKAPETTAAVNHQKVQEPAASDESISRSSSSAKMDTSAAPSEPQAQKPLMEDTMDFTDPALAFDENDPTTVRLRKEALRRAERERRMKEKEKYAAELADSDTDGKARKILKQTRLEEEEPELDYEEEEDQENRKSRKTRAVLWVIAVILIILIILALLYLTMGDQLLGALNLSVSVIPGNSILRFIRGA